MNFSANYKQYGWRLFSRAFKALLRRLGIQFESFYLLRYVIDEKELQYKMDQLDYTNVQQLELADLVASEAFSDEKKALFKDRYESGSYACYGIKDNGTLIYSTWISWRSMGYPKYFGQSKELGPEEALLEDSYCDPRYRGKGIHYKMNLFRIKQIMDKGKRDVVALVLKENVPALKVQLKSGFRIQKKISLRKIGKWKSIHEKPLS